MSNTTRWTTRRAAIGGFLVLALGVATVASADKSDFTTTASTAGTTGYLVGKQVEKDNLAQARDFTDTQAQALRREAAAGEGENLDSLAALLGESDKQAFGRWMQSHYAELYSQDATSKANLADRIVAMR